jgi:hypothetical protein
LVPYPDSFATLVAAAMLIFPSFGALVVAAALAGWFWLL